MGDYPIPGQEPQQDLTEEGIEPNPGPDDEPALAPPHPPDLTTQGIEPNPGPSSRTVTYAPSDRQRVIQYREMWDGPFKPLVFTSMACGYLGHDCEFEGQTRRHYSPECDESKDLVRLVDQLALPDWQARLNACEHVTLAMTFTKEAPYILGPVYKVAKLLYGTGIYNTSAISPAGLDALTDGMIKDLISSYIFITELVKSNQESVERFDFFLTWIFLIARARKPHWKMQYELPQTMSQWVNCQCRT